MKKAAYFLLILLFSSINTRAQHYYGYAQRLFLYQQPHARTEALGRGQVTLHDGPFSIFNNPASLSFSSGTNVEYSHLDPKYPFKKDGFYNTYGISCNTGKYGAFGFNYLSFSVGEPERNYSTSFPLRSFSDLNKNQLYMINYSRMILNDLSVGINLNYFFNREKDIYNDSPSIILNTYYFDLGLLKRFHLDNSEMHDLYIGLSLNNVSYAEARSSHFSLTFPTIMHLGASYEFRSGKSSFGGLKALQLLLAGEYMDVFETRYFTQVRLGAETILWEILKLRAGYHSETLDTEVSEGKVSSLNHFTYGIGLEIPLNKLANKSLPFSLSIDYANLPLPNYDDYSYIDPFSDIISRGPGFDSYMQKYNVFSVNLKFDL